MPVVSKLTMIAVASAGWLDSAKGAVSGAADSAKAAAGDAVSDATGGAIGGSGGCAPKGDGEEGDTWKCPADGGCPGGSCSGDKWEEWVAAHNIYRCMHDIPAVVWDMDVYDDCYSTFKDQSQMQHSASYDVKPPAGPAGENLFWASYVATPLEACAGWYSEFAECGPFPGCKDGASGTTGHFTSMSWKGVKSIGCAYGKEGLIACRYKAGDTLSADTPNMAGGYEANVLEKKRSYDECLAAVSKCGFKSGFDKVGDFTKLDCALGYDDSKSQALSLSFSSLSTSPLGFAAVAAVAGVALLVTRAKVFRAAQGATEVEEELMLPECEE